jgi:uncharacterized protein YbbK (DUF523 family)
MRLVDHPEQIATWPTPTEEEPWVVMISGCMMGESCSVNGDDYGFGGIMDPIANLSNVRVVSFCPEDVGLGTPRTTPDIHGGDGFDVLDGLARVKDERGVDLTDGMMAGARAMVEEAKLEKVRFAVLLDASGACGTQVISDGCRFDEPRKRRRGVGVAAAALARAGVRASRPVGTRSTTTKPSGSRRTSPSRGCGRSGGAVDLHGTTRPRMAGRLLRRRLGVAPVSEREGLADEPLPGCRSVHPAARARVRPE